MSRIGKKSDRAFKIFFGSGFEAKNVRVSGIVSSCRVSFENFGRQEARFFPLSALQAKILRKLGSGFGYWVEKRPGIGFRVPVTSLADICIKESVREGTVLDSIVLL